MGLPPEAMQDAIDAIADRLAIDDLYSRYIFALNWQDADTVASVFAEDGVLDWAGGVVAGRDAIRGEVERMRTHFARLEEADAPLHPARLRHFLTNKLIDIGWDEARSLAYWLEVNDDNRLRQPYVGAYGHYEDRLRRTPEGWRFVRRTIFNEQMSERAGPRDNPGR